MKYYTVLSGESYFVLADSEEEAISKFFWAEGHIEDKDAIRDGYDISTWKHEDVQENETRTEVV